MDVPNLRWTDEKGQKHTFALTDARITIGRKSDLMIVLRDPYVSRTHAHLVKTPSGGFEVIDLDSTHGSFVNGRQVKRQLLRSGDRLLLGKGRTEMTYHAGDHTSTERTVDSTLEGSMIELESVLPAYSNYTDLEKLNVLLDLQYSLGRNFSTSGAFQQILTSALKISGAERGFLLLREGEGFRYVVGLNHQGEQLEHEEFVQTSRTVVEEVLATGEAVCVTQGMPPRLAQQESILALNLRAVSGLPLRWSEPSSAEPQVRGILYLDSTNSMHTLTGLDQRILDKLAGEAAALFEKVDMIKQLREKEIIEKELSLARETQQYLLPQEIPQLEGYQILAYSQPTRHVGGDFFDFYRLETDDLVGVLADVSGKGISAALLSSLLQGAMDIELRAGHGPEVAIGQLNTLLCRRSPSNKFVTLFLFQLNERGAGVFISAGHTPAFHYRAASGKVESLMPQNTIVGAFEAVCFDSSPLQLDPGDLLVIYTDGLTEAEAASGEMFGDERLISLIAENGRLGAFALEGEIRNSINEFCGPHQQTDDITLMIIERDRPR